jgi:hypothetical protein
MSTVKTEKMTKTNSSGLSRPQELNPLNPKLTGAFQYMVGIGLITKLTATFEPGSIRVMGVPSELLASKSELLNSRLEASAVLLFNVAKEHKLIGDIKKKEKKPVAPIKPAKYLVLDDFDLSEKDFEARFKSVSTALGIGILGRMRSFEKEYEGGDAAGKFFDDLTPVEKAKLYVRPADHKAMSSKTNFSAYVEKIFLVDDLREELLAKADEPENRKSYITTGPASSNVGRGRKVDK